MPPWHLTLLSCPLPHCLSDVKLIPPCDRILLEMTFAELYRWAIQELRQAVITADMMFKLRGINPATPKVRGAKVRSVLFVFCLFLICFKYSKLLLSSHINVKVLKVIFFISIKLS